MLVPGRFSETVTVSPERASVLAVLPGAGASLAVDVAVAGSVIPPTIFNSALSPALPPAQTFSNDTLFLVRVLV